MEFIKKYGILILLVIVAFIFLPKVMGKTADSTTATTNQTYVPSPGTNATSSSRPGSPTGPVVLTRSQCRQTCQGKCGSRCIVPIGARCKAVKACWDTCKSETCSYISGDI